MHPGGSFTFATSGGGTRATFTLDADLTGVKKLLMGAPVQKSMDAEMAALDNTKPRSNGGRGAGHDVWSVKREGIDLWT